MSTEEAHSENSCPEEDLLGRAMSTEANMEQGRTKDSSSSTDGRDEPQQQANEEYNQAPIPLIVRPQVIFKLSDAAENPPIVSLTQSLQQETQQLPADSMIAEGSEQHISPTTEDSTRPIGIFQAPNPEPDINANHQIQFPVPPQNIINSEHISTMGMMNHNATLSGNESIQNIMSNGFGTSNHFNIPIPNLPPPEFPLPSPSRLYAPNTSLPFPSLPMPVSLLNGGARSSLGRLQWTDLPPAKRYAMQDASTLPRLPEFQFPNLRNQSTGSSHLFQTPQQPAPTGGENVSNVGTPFVHRPEALPPNLFKQGMAGNFASRNNFEVGESSSRSPRLLNLMGRAPMSRGQSSNPPPSREGIRNSVYDPMYELMGFPVDPHLRMFAARREEHTKIYDHSKF